MTKKRINELHIVDKETTSELERKLMKHKAIKGFLMASYGFICLFAIFFSISIFKTISDFPDVAILGDTRDQTTILYDINDNPVANIHGDEDRVIVPVDKMSHWLKNAVIAIEDNRFYSHNGIDFIGTLRAAVTNFSGSDEMQGGSTLTQQLVKNSFLSSKRSIKRKLIEAILAVKVEKKYDKDKILEMYLNQIYWGNRCYGVEKAAHRYFRKQANELDLAQSSLLAGLLKAPEGYSPYSNLEGAKLRQNLVLSKMEEYGYITREQREKAMAQKLEFAPKAQQNSKYAYFIHYVTSELRKRYGDDTTRRGGLRVYTTLNPKVQEIAESVMVSSLDKFGAYSGASQGALVCLDVEKGYVQALVGGKDYAESNFNRATQSKRAAGSSFKPVVYLTGFRLGKITPETPIMDAPISFNTGWSIWSPHNWDGRYMGRMNVRSALTQSRNTPTVRVALKVGVQKIIETARLVGLKGHIDRNFSIALGSLGISPLDMATVFSTYARNGSYIEATAIRRIEDSTGKLIEKSQSEAVQVIDKKYVGWLNSILIDVVEKGTGKHAQLKDRVVAGKTGTSDEIRDIWFTGFTPDMVTTVWLGNDRNTPLHGVFSSTCAQIWGDFAKQYYKVVSVTPKTFKLSEDDWKNTILEDEEDITEEENEEKEDKKLKEDETVTTTTPTTQAITPPPQVNTTTTKPNIVRPQYQYPKTQTQQRAQAQRNNYRNNYQQNYNNYQQNYNNRTNNQNYNRTNNYAYQQRVQRARRALQNYRRGYNNNNYNRNYNYNQNYRTYRPQ